MPTIKAPTTMNNEDVIFRVNDSTDRTAGYIQHSSDRNGESNPLIEKQLLGYSCCWATAVGMCATIYNTIARFDLFSSNEESNGTFPKILRSRR
mmetsp:Transcript_23190/g.41896  ORF Transcript_23190/g.41896 Transcript_23190/m.41896 type:complete len:94 (+) Transcript_23190:1343-1624(+)